MQIKNITPSYQDARGDISHLLEFDGKVKTALYITSKVGAIRANHYHKKDTHYTYLVSGQFEYWEKVIGDKKALVKKKMINPGDLVVTPPMIAHTMKFTKDSLMVVFTTEKRDQASYEQDTVRIDLNT